MFDAIIFKNAIGPGPLIDVGALAEALIFYGRVGIVGNTGTIRDLLSRVPPFVILSLLRDCRLEFHYLADQIGVSTTPFTDGIERHSLVRFSSPDHTIETATRKAFLEAAGNSSQAKLGASRFTKLLSNLDHAQFDQESVLLALSDHSATAASVELLLREVVPSFSRPPDLRFSLHRESQGFRVDTNIDFAQVNQIYHQRVPASHSSITAAYLLALMQGAYEATYLAAKLNAEVAVHPVERAVHAKTIDAVVARYLHSSAQIESFSNLTLTDSYSIREAVNTGKVGFSEVLRLLDSADKFREWLRGQPPTEDLVRIYYRAVVKESWAEKLPARVTRWGIFSAIGLGIDALGAGGIGTAVGQAVSAVDAFVIDKMLKGWKPHHFVENDLRPTLEKSANDK